MAESSRGLNQVELWFAKLQHDVIRRGVFTSVAVFGRKLRRYIRLYSKSDCDFVPRRAARHRQRLHVPSPASVIRLNAPMRKPACGSDKRAR
jgi:hypothetical protein